MNCTESNNLPIELAVWPDGQTPYASPADGVLPRLTYYLPSDEYRTGQSMLILPGGGYEMVSTPKEGHRPAQFLAAHGIAAAVLEYRHAPQRHPVPLLDAQRALRILRDQAQQHAGLDANKVGCMGFSAGGHLSGLLATQPEVNQGRIGDALDHLSCAPDFFAMIYAVVAFDEAHTHQGSQHNLIGADAPQALIDQLSVEKAVSQKTPPCFITHGQGDGVVPVENALMLYRALTAHKVATTMYLFEEDQHGIGLAGNHAWSQQLLQWLQHKLSHRS